MVFFNNSHLQESSESRLITNQRFVESNKIEVLSF